MTIKEYAEYIGKAERTVTDMLNSGKLKHINLPSRKICGVSRLIEVEMVLSTTPPNNNPLTTEGLLNNMRRISASLGGDSCLG